MVGPSLAYRARLLATPTARGTVMDRLMNPGMCEVRPCGCQNDPVVFGHTWSMCPVRRADERAR